MMRAVDKDQDEAVFVPYTVLGAMTARSYLQTITVGVEEAGVASQVGDAITALLRERHEKSRPQMAESAKALGGLQAPGAKPGLGPADDFVVRTLAAQQGDYDQAVGRYMASLEIRERLGDTAGMGGLLSNLGVVAEIADDVAVMYAGRIVQHASVYELFERPLHPYTRGLLAARPSLDGPRDAPLQTIAGMVPALAELPPGCRFAPRCPLVEQVCRERMPELVQIGNKGKHLVACHVAQREAQA